MNTQQFDKATAQQVVYEWMRPRGGVTPGDIADALYERLNPDARVSLAIRHGKPREDNRRKVWARRLLRRLEQRGMVYRRKEGHPNGHSPTLWFITTPDSSLIY